MSHFQHMRCALLLRPSPESFLRLLLLGEVHPVGPILPFRVLRRMH